VRVISIVLGAAIQYDAHWRDHAVSDPITRSVAIERSASREW
jgi:hypothetical protein